jgi:uncharacterized protein YndB with AHSA1/START domain
MSLNRLVVFVQIQNGAFMSLDLEKKEVRVSWRYPYPRETIFQALSEGRLLMTCGPKMDEFRHDFRVGGAWQFAYCTGGPTKTCKGKYLEIVPNERVRFTWDELKNFYKEESSSSSSSEVTATLTTKGAYTHLEIVHNKVENIEWAHSFHQGWTEVLALFLDEIDGTTLRLSYDYNVGAGQVYQAISKGLLFRCVTNAADFARGTIDFRAGGLYHFPIGTDDYVRGSFTKVSSTEIRFTWSTNDSGVKVDDTDVVIYLEEISSSKTRLHLAHDGLQPANVSKSHEQGWTDALKSFAGALS